MSFLSEEFQLKPDFIVAFWTVFFQCFHMEDIKAEIHQAFLFWQSFEIENFSRQEQRKNCYKPSELLASVLNILIKKSFICILIKIVNLFS